MTTGQTRVLVLLMLLVALEAIRIKAVHDFIVGIIHSIGSGINLASNSSPGPSITQQEQSKPDSKGNCPPGSVLLNGICYNVKGV